jgi:hypothetical protein
MHHARGLLSVSAVLLLVGGGANSARADITFSDSTFNDADWTVHTVTTGASGTSVGVQTGGGNPGTGREVTNTLDLSCLLYSMHTYGITPATAYQPTIDGAVGTVDYTIDSKWLAGVGGQGHGIALGALQGMNLYYGIYQITGSTGAWNTHANAGMVASDFVPFNGGPAIDFSASGAPIHFGFVVGNYAPDQAYFNTVIYDNFSVTIHSVPAPAAAGALFGMGGLAGLSSRRRRA